MHFGHLHLQHVPRIASHDMLTTDDINDSRSFCTLIFVVALPAVPVKTPTVKVICCMVELLTLAGDGAGTGWVPARLCEAAQAPG